MNITQTIQQLIDQAKKQPNSLLRNKLVSKLEDAKIVSRLIDFETQNQYGPIPLSSAPTTAPTTNAGCTCMPGARSASCPYHR